METNLSEEDKDRILQERADNMILNGQISVDGITPADYDRVAPWDLLDPDKRVDPVVRDERMAVCQKCPRLFKLTHTCKECGCFMALKTKLKDATCPLGKW